MVECCGQSTELIWVTALNYWLLIEDASTCQGQTRCSAEITNGQRHPGSSVFAIQIQIGSRYFSKIHLHVKNACLSLNVAWWCSWILCSSTAWWLSRRQGIVPVSTIFHQSPPAGGHVTTMSPKLHQCHQGTPLYVPWPDQWGGRAYVLGGLLSWVIKNPRYYDWQLSGSTCKITYWYFDEMINLFCLDSFWSDDYPGARASSPPALCFLFPTGGFPLPRSKLLRFMFYSERHSQHFPGAQITSYVRLFRMTFTRGTRRETHRGTRR